MPGVLETSRTCNALAEIAGRVSVQHEMDRDVQKWLSNEGSFKECFNRTSKSDWLPSTARDQPILVRRAQAIRRAGHTGRMKPARGDAAIFDRRDPIRLPVLAFGTD